MKLALYISVLMMILTSCQPSSSGKITLPNESSAPLDETFSNIPYEDDVPVIGLVSKYSGGFFLDTAIKTARALLSDSAYYTITKSPSSYTNAVPQQIRILEEFILSEVDGIILLPNDGQALNPLIARALNAGIPVVIVDTPIDTDDLFAMGVNVDLLSFVLIDNFTAAYDAANTYFNTLTGSYNCLVISGDTQNPHAIDRRDGVIQAIGDYDNVDLVKYVDGEWQEHIAYQIVLDELKEDDSINLISCSNDNMALGAILALKQMNLEDVVKVTGFDASEDAKQAIIDGELEYTVLQEPLDFGVKAAEVMMELIEDGSTDRYHFIKTQLLVEGIPKDDSDN